MALVACTGGAWARGIYTQDYSPAEDLEEFDQAGGNNGVWTSANLNVPDNITIAMMTVKLKGLAHEWSGDLVVQLQKVGGPTVTLLHRVGSISGTFGAPNPFGDVFGFGEDYTFSSTGGANIWTTAMGLTEPDDPIPGGTYQTSGAVSTGDAAATWGANNNALLTFNGMNAMGNWRLIITDLSSPHPGSIEGWELNIIPSPGALALIGMGLVCGRRRRLERN